MNGFQRVSIVSSFASASIALAAPGDLTTEERRLAIPNGGEVVIDDGTIEVPANRARPESGTLRLAFSRVRSLAVDPAAPVFYLAGGPGGSSTSMASNLGSLRNWRSVLETCDIVFLDQRGTGQSEPDVSVRAPRVPTNVFSSREHAVAALEEIAQFARSELASRGVDLHGFDTPHAADDINDLRAALGYERISLLGFSYGTHLAQAVMRRHPDHLAGAILAGVEGLDQTYKLPLHMDTQFRKLGLLAKDDPNVAPHVPDLVALYQRVSERLEREPMVVPVTHPQTKVDYDIPVGAYGLALILRFDMGDNRDLPVFPRLLHSIDQGETEILRWFVNRRVGMLMGLNAMSIFTDGASGARPGRLAMIEDQAKRSMFFDVMNFPFPESAEFWGVPDLGDEYRAPLVSEVRTLLLSGTLDWNCPPFQAEQLRWGLPRAAHICVLNAGHEQILTHPKVQEAIVRFLGGEDVDDGYETWPPLRFVPIVGAVEGAPTHWSVPRD